MEVARFKRLQHTMIQFLGEVCPHCDAKLFPPQGVCPECRIKDKREQPELVTRGNVFQPNVKVYETTS